MTSFAEQQITFADGQVNVTELPTAIMANGFIPETRDAPGMPLPAQYLNWLFRDLYRHINQLIEKNSSIQKIEQFIEGIYPIIEGAHPVGTPIPWPLATPPTGWILCNGATFNKNNYPKLAIAYPTGQLPDLRGEFIRGWDNGRSIDEKRKLLSFQQDTLQNIIGSLAIEQEYSLTHLSGAFYADGSVRSKSSRPEGEFDELIKFDASRVARTSQETRPRNIAFNYIVNAS